MSHFKKRFGRWMLVLGLAGAMTASWPACTNAEDKTPVMVNKEEVQKSLADAERMGWKIGVQAWTFNYLTLFGAIDTVSSLGLKYIELFPGQNLSKSKPGVKFDHNSPQDLREEVKAKLKEAGVTALSYGVVGGWPKDEASARKVFDFARDMGIQTVVCEPPLEKAELVDKLANEYGIRIALHDHPKPSTYWSPESVLKFCEGRSKMVGSCADTGHWYRSGMSPVECLKKLDGRVIESHFKDVDEKKVDVPFGIGKCDVEGMLRELHRQGFKGCFWIEYEHNTPHLLQDVQACVQQFAKVSQAIAAKAESPSSPTGERVADQPK